MSKSKNEENKDALVIVNHFINDPKIASGSPIILQGFEIIRKALEAQQGVDVDDWSCNDFTPLPEDRIKELMANTAYPESRSVHQAMSQACNELYHLNKHLRKKQSVDVEALKIAPADVLEMHNVYENGIDAEAAIHVAGGYNKAVTDLSERGLIGGVLSSKERSILNLVNNGWIVQGVEGYNPEQYALVPVEPTDKQLEEMYFNVISGDDGGVCDKFLRYAKDIHGAMIRVSQEGK